MSLPKALTLLSLLLFGVIGAVALFNEHKRSPSSNPMNTPVEIELDHDIQVVLPAHTSKSETKKIQKEQEIVRIDLPEANQIEELFNKEGSKLPIVETITYKSHVPWQKGRPAWLSDYAAHYDTSRHFIARSLNGKPDYLKQDLREGATFNVLRKDKKFEFYLIVDTSRCKMWFYYIDLDNKSKVLLKTYHVGLGRLDSSKTSGLLTPLGKYALGHRVAIYKSKTMGTHQSKKVEMITIFGTRWIPFEKEIGICTAPAKGFGIHGTPWTIGAKGEMIDNKDSIGKYESDGCIRLATPDMEELFAVIITKPTTIEIVRDFTESSFVDK